MLQRADELICEAADELDPDLGAELMRFWARLGRRQAARNSSVSVGLLVLGAAAAAVINFDRWVELSAL